MRVYHPEPKYTRTIAWYGATMPRIVMELTVRLCSTESEQTSYDACCRVTCDEDFMGCKHLGVAIRFIQSNQGPKARDRVQLLLIPVVTDRDERVTNVPAHTGLEYSGNGAKSRR